MPIQFPVSHDHRALELFSRNISADEPARMDTDIIMINMNMANIQMNMGDFRGSEYAADGFSYNNTMQFLSGMSAADKDQITELLAMTELQAGFATLAQNLPGFQSFVDSMLPATEAPATDTTTTTEAAGMVRHKVLLYESYNISHIFHIWIRAYNPLVGFYDGECFANL